MKHLAAATFLACSMAEASQGTPKPDPKPSPDVLAVAPQLYNYTTDLLFAEVWKRKDLEPRDRSLITLASLLAGGQTAQMTGHINLGLDNGLKPGEITALITHLAFYSGWPNAMSAATVAKKVFAERGITSEQLQPSKEQLTLNEESEKKRRESVENAVGSVAPDLARYTNDVLFGDLWRNTDLSPRDRSLVTVAALITQNQSAQLPFHLNRAMDNGLTQAQASEVVTHLAFYAGWPKAMSAVPVLKEVLDSRKS